MIAFLDVSGDQMSPTDVPAGIMFIYCGCEHTNVKKRKYAYFQTGIGVDDYTVAMWYDNYMNRKKLAQSMPTMHKYLKDTVFS